jgi:hypothetical protein
MPTLPRLLSAAALLAALSLAACKQGEGERCQVNDDCESGLVCVERTGTCGTSNIAPEVDAGPVDAEVPDATLADAATPDAALPDAALPDAALPDASPNAQ